MIDTFLKRSRATPAFHAAIERFLATSAANDRIVFDGRSPTVKVERVLTQLLGREPELEVDAVSLNASSGCEYYRGELTVRLRDGSETAFRFYWDCRWRAEREGWVDHFGFPDQIRAARQFGYDCFRDWEPLIARAETRDRSLDQ